MEKPLSPAQMKEKLMENEAPSRDVLEIISKRATCRSFRTDPIPDAVMEKLLEAACSSASSGGFQRISIVVVRDAAKKKRLAQLSREQGFIAKAPASFVFCVDHRRMRRIAEYEASPCDTGDSVVSLCMGFVDATIAAQSMALAAQAQGLRSCYNGNVLDMPGEMTQLLELPSGVVPAIMLTVGYPVSPNGRLSRKYSPRVMVHEEVYRDMPIEALHAEHGKKFPETYRLSDERRERLFHAAKAQAGEAFARRCLARADTAERLTAYQFWFGCYYYDEDRAEADAGEYLDYLAGQGFDITGRKKNS